MAEQLPFLNASPIRGSSSKKTKKQSKTVAERIAWMSRTSDVVGSFHNNSAEANTTLIRRKIQERCGNTQELMATIRRLKTGNTSHVTPNEFRLTLLKFGISIPQNLVDSIFNLFDSDGSGTIDFDEFAMWIMNSEFRPVNKDKAESKADPNEVIRAKLRECITTYPEVFEAMKKRISFLDLVADISRRDMVLSEKEGRRIFQALDPKNTGLIESAKLRRFAFEGVTETPPLTAKQFVKPDLNDAVFRICGKHTNLLLDCFTHYDASAELEFDEFKRALLSNNLGLNSKDAYNLFLALEGRYGKCKIRVLKENIRPMASDPSCEVAAKVGHMKHVSALGHSARVHDVFF